MSNGTPPLGVHDYAPIVEYELKHEDVDGNIKATEGTCHCFGNGTCYTCVAAMPAFVPLAAKCECGSDKANVPYHSSWCPKFDKNL